MYIYIYIEIRYWGDAQKVVQLHGFGTTTTLINPCTFVNHCQPIFM